MYDGTLPNFVIICHSLPLFAAACLNYVANTLPYFATHC